MSNVLTLDVRLKVTTQHYCCSYPAVSRNPGQYSDNDGDGFEDVTALPTHYDQCYAGLERLDGYNDSNWC